VFPKYFTKNDVNDFVRKPEKIANRVYANRMGNGNQNSGDVGSTAEVDLFN